MAGEPIRKEKPVKLIATLFALFCVATLASASCVEVQQSETGRVYQMFLYEPLEGKLGAFGYAMLTGSWNEAYAGLDYQVSKNLEVGYGLGVETGGRREGGYAIVSEGKFALKYYFEDGETGAWRKSVLEYQATPKLNLGVADDLFKGTGPKVDYRLTPETTIRMIAYPEITTFSLVASF